VHSRRTQLPLTSRRPALQSGVVNDYVNDYVTWLVTGPAAIGAILAPLFANNQFPDIS